MAMHQRPSRAPPGYAALAVDPSQILLQLTISNKCGQAFRWRAVDVYEPFEKNEGGNLSACKLEEPSGSLPASSPTVKQESDASRVRVKQEDNFDQREISALKSLPESKQLYRKTTEWSICLPDRVVLLRQDEERGYIYHRTLLGSNADAQQRALGEEKTQVATEAWLCDYLNLHVPLEAMYEEWSLKDPVFKRFATRFAGLRMLRQDPIECLFAFICSSNNNIARIGQMVQSLCTNYAEPIASITYPPPPPGVADGDEDFQPAPTSITFHPFPDVSRLAHNDVESNLRQLMFGYRARYVQETAQRLLEIVASSQAGDFDPDTEDEDKQHVLAGRRFDDVAAYLSHLRTLSYEPARQQLMQFNGVGPKVADCILLMSLDQHDSIPVDRHVFQFAERWYRIRTKGGLKGYEHIADFFRKLWGGYAGWAHSVLFTADLRAFQTYKAEPKEEAEEDDTKPNVKSERETEPAAPPGVLPGAASYEPPTIAVAAPAGTDAKLKEMTNGHTPVNGAAHPSATGASARDARQQRRMERVLEESKEANGTATVNDSRKTKKRRQALNSVRPPHNSLPKDFSPRKSIHSASRSPQPRHVKDTS